MKAQHMHHHFVHRFPYAQQITRRHHMDAQVHWVVRAPVFLIALGPELLAALGLSVEPHDAVVTANDRRHVAKRAGRPSPDEVRDALHKVLYVGARRAHLPQREFVCRSPRGRLMLVALDVLPGQPLAPAGVSRVPTAFWIDESELRRRVRRGWLKPWHRAP